MTHDGRIVRYPDTAIKVNDTVQIDIASGKITNWIKFDTGNLANVTGGRNLGQVGTITNRERHLGSFDIIHIKDAIGHTLQDYQMCLLLSRAISQMSPYQLVKVCVSLLLKRRIEDRTELDKIFEHSFALIYNVRRECIELYQ